MAEQPTPGLTHEAISQALAERLAEIARVVPAEQQRAAIEEAHRQADALREVLRKGEGQGRAPYRCEVISGPGWWGFRCY